MFYAKYKQVLQNNIYNINRLKPIRIYLNTQLYNKKYLLFNYNKLYYINYFNKILIWTLFKFINILNINEFLFFYSNYKIKYNIQLYINITAKYDFTNSNITLYKYYYYICTKNINIL